MRSGRLLLGALLVVVACKKDQPAGLPPAGDWQAAPPSPSATGPARTPAGGAARAPGMGGAPATSDPHAGMGGAPATSNPHAGMGGAPATSNPHGDMQPNVTPQKTGPRTLDKLADGRVALGPFSVSLPADWVEKPTTSSMRAAEFVLSAKPGEEAGLIVYYFGDSGAGSVDANLERWIGQFQQPDGKPSRDAAKVEKLKIADHDATVVTVSGRYVASAMPGATEAVDRPDQTMIAAIVGSPTGPYYFKTVGAKKTVEAHAGKLRAMLGSLKLR